ncbi:hypothetical protein [Thalassomonas actiniarum]|uniref:Uncharacterized protein n=1 Tax=Thalassomonas actiniarum TaxID=485447 RepID=A0AAF0C1C0_9GAMM|nr:hypothetical protein [Thalassomonas actiniarum]WDD96610.1 hypothetical protein SG35_014600 [Thalassomonas actiniarum]
MAKPNDMPEFQSVKAYLTESLIENTLAAITRVSPVTDASSYAPLNNNGGGCHV